MGALRYFAVGSSVTASSRAQALDFVAQPRGFLEIEVRGGFAHARLRSPITASKLWPMVAASANSPSAPAPVPVDTSTWSRS